MRRGRSAIGTELVPLVLILASLAGSLALVIAIHRRFVSRSAAEKPPVAVVATLQPTPDKTKPIATPSREPIADEPEPPPPPTPEDPTPKVVAKLVAAEAEQLLEASKADRKAVALEVAKKAAQAESEKWRRRESLVRLQLDTLETKVHQLETQADELALERDALEKEVDIRKALAAQARSRPSTAILPHRGQNGTWRRPIVVECVNGMAILRPQNLGFGLLDLASGFSPATNPFVAAIAREAIRIQGNDSPDGQQVTPYIFFLVRPDGIRTYYEARGRLEPLGITFGYELADQDWQIDFPDLDDTKTWDGSGPALPPRADPLAQLRSRLPGSSPAEEESLPNLSLTPATSPGGAGGSGNEFTWPARPRVAPSGNGGVTLGGSGSGTGSGGIGNPGGSRGLGSPGGLANAVSGSSRPGGSGGGSIRYPSGTSGVSTLDPTTGSVSDDLPPASPPRELALGGAIPTLPQAGSSNPGSPGPNSTSGFNGSLPPPISTSPGQGITDVPTGGYPANLPPVVSPRTSPNSGSGTSTNIPPQSQTVPSDPTSPYVLPSPGIPLNQIPASVSGARSNAPPVSPNQSPPVRHIGPFSRPLAAGLDPTLLASSSNPPSTPLPPDAYDPTQPDSPNPGSSGVSGGITNRNQTTSSANSSSTPNSSQKSGGTAPATSAPSVTGDASASPTAPGSPPPPFTLGMTTPGAPSSATPFSSPGNAMPPPPPDTSSPPRFSRPVPPPMQNKTFKIIDRRYEIVVVCNQRGVIVQPGAYRVTVDALKNREGLLKAQIVALVKAKRTADPKTTIEPQIRFLVQPGGEGTYWIARSQFAISGLDWPTTTQVADRDHLTNLPSESW